MVWKSYSHFVDQSSTETMELRSALIFDVGPIAFILRLYGLFPATVSKERINFSYCSLLAISSLFHVVVCWGISFTRVILLTETSLARKGQLSLYGLQLFLKGLPAAMTFGIVVSLVDSLIKTDKILKRKPNTRNRWFWPVLSLSIYSTSMENGLPSLFIQNEHHASLLHLGDSFEVQDIITNEKEKKKCSKKSSSRKTKPSPVMRVDEETIANSSVSENSMNTPEEFDKINQSDTLNNSGSLEDESLLIHLVLSKILDRKKMELLDCDEVRHILTARSLKK